MVVRAADYWKAREILIKHRIPVSEGLILNNEVDAVKAARKIGYPVVMKLVSSEATHKSDIGGVITHINCDEEVIISFRDLIKKAEKHGLKLKGISVEKMEKGLELIVGVKTDIVFGKVVVLGLGGIFTEIIKDISVRVLPIKKSDVLDMLNDLKYGFLLNGFRNYPTASRKKIADFVMRVIKMVEKEKVYEMDLNPVFVWKDRVIAADVRMILER